MVVQILYDIYLSTPAVAETTDGSREFDWQWGKGLHVHLLLRHIHNNVMYMYVQYQFYFFTKCMHTY